MNSVFNRRLLIVYILFWVLISGIHIVLLYFAYDIPFKQSYIESGVFNCLFGLIGIGLWYTVYYSSSEEKGFFQSVLQYFAYGILSIGIWISLGFYLLNKIFGADTQAINFISTTIPWRIATGILIYSLIILFYYSIVYYNNFRDKSDKESKLRVLIRESELKNLKSQINPHFLFNALNSISSLTMISPEKAQDMVIKLSEFMRYSLARKDDQLVTLQIEMDNIDKYLEIEKIRFGERLILNRQIHEYCKFAKVPALILQPIFENAIKYGVYESIDQSEIMIKCLVIDDYLRVKISNTYDPDYSNKKGEGIGLLNISKRMNIIYGRTDLIKIEKTPSIFSVTLLFPQKINK